MTPATQDEQADEEDLEPAARRQAWRASAEHAQIGKRTATIITAGFLLGALSGGAFGGLTYEPSYGGGSRLWQVLQWGGFGALIGVIFGLYVSLFALASLRRAFHDRYTLEQSRARLTEAEQVVVDAGSDTSFNALWVATQKRLDYYHEIATNQSQRSFAYGQVAAATGLVVVLLCTVLAIAADSASGAVAAGVLGAAGAAMSGYIGSTFLRTQDLAASQLRDYFGQPLEFSRFLSAERLLDEISDPARREEATLALVRAIAERPK